MNSETKDVKSEDSSAKATNENDKKRPGEHGHDGEAGSPTKKARPEDSSAKTEATTANETSKKRSGDHDARAESPTKKAKSEVPATAS